MSQMSNCILADDERVLTENLGMHVVARLAAHKQDSGRNVACDNNLYDLCSLYQ